MRSIITSPSENPSMIFLRLSNKKSGSHFKQSKKAKANQSNTIQYNTIQKQSLQHIIYLSRMTSATTTIKKKVSSSPDGETRTSRVIGSVDFCRPTISSSSEYNDDELIVMKGIRCQMPFTLKCLKPPKSDDDDDDDDNNNQTTKQKKIQNQMENIANQVFDDVEKHLNNYNLRSEVNFINNDLPPNTSLEISNPLKEVLLCAKDLIKLTRGAFDPSAAALLKHYEQLALRSMFASSSSDSLPLPSATTNSSKELLEEEEKKENPDEDEEQEEEDIETIRRQRAVVEHMRGLMYRGFADHPSDNRVSRSVKRLIEISQWSNAFSVSPSSSSAVGDTKDTYTIRKKHAEAKLDLNGIAKGWAVDAIADQLPSPCYVEWGGDVKVHGQHPSGRNWQVAVPEPPSIKQIQSKVEQAKKSGQKGPVYKLASEYAKDGDSKDKQYLAILELRDGDAVATSGDYENVIERDGKLYSHIINPQLGRLLELNRDTLAQAVVVAKSCMVADALATAAISKEDPSQARAMLDPFRTGYRKPMSDYLLYARYGPRILRLTIPGVCPKAHKEARLKRHEPATVIVVGAGLAGMAAAIEAAEARAKVIILEKEDKTGGNSAKATSGMNGWGTDTQAELGVADEERLFERDTFRSGLGGNSNPSLVRAVSTKSAAAVHWLKHKFGIPMNALSQCGGHSRKRTHRAPPDSQGRPVPIGWLIMNTLKNAVETQYKENIEIRCGQTVTKLLHTVDDDNVKTIIGVQVNGTTDLHADAVVLSTGGFGCSGHAGAGGGLMARFRPDLLGCPTTNGNFAQGDGVSMGEEVGADLIDMDKVQLHPTGFINPKDPSNATKILAPEAIRGCGGILVNSEGKRFVNELDLRSVVSGAIQKHCSNYKGTVKRDDGGVDECEGPPFAWCILSEAAQKSFGESALDFYKDKMGLFDSCETYKEAAKLIGCDEQVLYETFEAYKNACSTKICPLTGKDVFPTILSPESQNIIIARVTPSIHYTMGGLNINAAGEVQERVTDSTVGSHRRIRRLFAAGEVTGGVHGGNRLAGNSLLECVVFGRIAGQRAATIKIPDKVMFPEAASDDSKPEANWHPVVVREVRNTDKEYGMNTREVRFNLHGSVQESGLKVGQFIALRGELDGETLMGYFSPITRPSDEGVIGILCRVDAKGGPITSLLENTRPGSCLQMSAMGGLRLQFERERIHFKGNEIKRIGLLAGGTGIAPMIQIIRAYGKYVRESPTPIEPLGINLIYAAEEVGDLAYMKILEDVKAQIPEHFRYYVVLNRPPLGWTEGVGFIERQDIVKRMFFPPADGDLAVMCGPPVFESAMRKTLAGLGFERHQWFSFSEDDHVSAHI